jgi:hypothetical protein
MCARVLARAGPRSSCIERTIRNRVVERPGMFGHTIKRSEVYRNWGAKLKKLYLGKLGLCHEGNQDDNEQNHCGLSAHMQDSCATVISTRHLMKEAIRNRRTVVAFETKASLFKLCTIYIGKARFEKSEIFKFIPHFQQSCSARYGLRADPYLLGTDSPRQSIHACTLTISLQHRPLPEG